MALGIDSGTILRVAGERGAQSLFGARGAPPCRNHESGFVWRDKRVQRQTAQRGIVSFEEAWANFIAAEETSYFWDLEGQQLSSSWDVLVSGAFQQLISTEGGKTAIANDNSFFEKAQDRLLSLCSRAHLLNVDLLWRPVAIALDFLNTNHQVPVQEGSRLLIIDAESTHPEATQLELRMRDGVLVPLRRPYREEDKLEVDWCSNSARKALAGKLADENKDVTEALLAGEFCADFSRFRDGEQVDYTWVKKGIRYEPFSLQRSLSDLCAAKTVDGGSVDNLVQAGRQRALDVGADVILWHGWPFRCLKDLNDSVDHVMSAHSVTQGTRLYAERIDAKVLTYLESLPLLEIMSKNHQTGRFEFFPIIEAGEYPGGQKVPIDPINRFDMQKGITSLPIVLQRSDWDSARKVEFDHIPEIDENAPVTITGELKPGQGHLKLWMESRDGREDLFGEQRRIEINWETMKDFDLPEQTREKCSPDVYPIAGRVFDDDDPDMMLALKDMVNAGGRITREVNYKGHQVRFNKVFDLWGYKTPWGAMLKESTRGMFGSLYVEDQEILDLSRRLSANIQQHHQTNLGKRHEYLNKMFIYTSPEFVQELRDIFSTENPTITSWNTAFAPGRVFSTAVDMEIFLNFLVSSCSEDSWPKWPDSSYTTKYFWSVFRCLCYYEDTANIECDLADKITLRICNYIEHRNVNGWAALPDEEGGRWTASNIKNAQKFCLCAFLFSTRFRDYCPRYLEYPCSPDSLTQRVADAINGMPPVAFPPTMGLDGGDGDNLSQFTLRFIKKEVTKEDFSALEGLVTSMT